MKKLAIVLVMALFLVCTGCTDHNRARIWGGTSTIQLEPNQRLMMITWKDKDLWYLTEPMPDGYEPQTKMFHESSEFGVNEGTIVIIESRK